MTDPIARLNAALQGRYRIERELGAGGMATVYLAEDLKHDRRVAIKVLKPELTAVLGGDRFLQEIKTTAQLQHPHILPLFDSGTADGFLFYVMPYIDGETLRAKLDREAQLGIDESVRIAREVADALDYAHRHGVVHRDIKPENILLHDGRPVVADFGIALALSAAAGGRMTETGTSVGTPHYMAPEQATGDRQITGRADIYALASVLYEMLAGDPPHTGSSAQQVIMRIIADSPRPVAELRKSVPPNVADATMQALEKLPADRFETAKAFADALGDPAFRTAIRGGRPVGGPGLSGVGTVVAAAVAALAVGIAGTALLLRTGDAPAPTARLMLETPEAEQPLHGGVFDIPMLGQDPAGRGLYYFGPDGTTGAQLMFRSWDRLSVDRLSHTAAFGCCVVHSPTGDSIAWETDRAVFVAPITGIARSVVESGLSVPTEAGGGIDWADDGWLYASGAGGLLRVSPRGGPVEMLVPLDTARGDVRYLWPAVLPGSRAALVTVLPGRGASDPTAASIGVADLATGRVDILLQGVRAIHAPTGHLIIAKADGGLWAAPFDVGTRRVTGRERALPDSTYSISTLASSVDLSLSPTGTLVYARRPFVPFQAVWVDRNGATQPVATDLGGTTLFDPALSHDGRLAITLMADDGRFDVWVKSLDGGPRSPIALDRPGSMRPAWRPDAGSLVFVSSVGTATGGLELFERNADGSGTTRKLAVGDSRNIGGATWSPDGTWLVLRTDNGQAGNGDILAIRPGVDTIARPVIATPGQDLAPAVSPDGRWIAYSSDVLGRYEIFVSPFPETGDTRYQVSLNGGITPVWRRNGRELFYVDAASNLVSVPVPADPGPAFQHGEPTVLFSMSSFALSPFYPQFDVTADGERFLMVKAETDAGLNIVVVFNFLEELKRIMEAP